MYHITNLEGWINVVVPSETEEIAAGTSTITSAEVDIGADFDSFLVLAGIGTAAANNTLTVTTSETSGGTFAANGISAVAFGATNAHAALRVEATKHRYVKVVVARGTSTTINYAIVIPYSSKSGLKAPASDWTTNHSYAGYVTPEA